MGLLGAHISRISEASIVFQVKNVRNLNEREVQNLGGNGIAMIFQDPYSSLTPRILVGKAIMEPMQVQGLHKNDKQRKAKTIEILRRVGLGLSFLTDTNMSFQEDRDRE
ncbi:MAG: peptide/nickel transport system ATP-binding protein [Candidatus Azotimanducaceae bacterium]|jgi:peptide/nickel transport system ATP-binding protein